jgi:hypothetical protein
VRRVARLIAIGRLLGALAAIGLALGTPPAVAHSGSASSIAVDYEARLLGVRPVTGGIDARAVGGDIELSLTVAPSRVVVVLGELGEPFLRFARGGVYANRRSPTAAEIRLVTLRPGGLRATPVWSRLSGRHTFAWHESRLRPRAARHDGRVGGIAIPLVVDGRAATLVGSSWHASRPALWPWILLALAPAAVLLALARARGRSLPHTVVPFAVVALGAAAACLAGRTLAGPERAAWAGVQVAAIALVAIVALACLVRLGPTSRPLIGAGIGVLVTLYGAESLPVLLHGFVLSRLPADADRAGTVLGLGAGLCLIGLLAVVLLPDLAEKRESPAHAGLSRGALERT